MPPKAQTRASIEAELNETEIFELAGRLRQVLVEIDELDVLLKQAERRSQWKQSDPIALRLARVGVSVRSVSGIKRLCRFIDDLDEEQTRLSQAIEALHVLEGEGHRAFGERAAIVHRLHSPGMKLLAKARFMRSAASQA